MKNMTLGLLMFCFGFLGWILTYYLGSIMGQLANQTGSYPPSQAVALIFYIISFGLMVGGFLVGIKKNKNAF